MSNFTEYKERKEVVEAFRFDLEDHDPSHVLEAFGADPQNYSIHIFDGRWMVEFERWPKKKEPTLVQTNPYGIYYGSTIVSDTGRFYNPIRVTEGDWVVKRHLDTDPETVVMSDKDFRRKFRVS